jgi:hypothetical protein
MPKDSYEAAWENVELGERIQVRNKEKSAHALNNYKRIKKNSCRIARQYFIVSAMAMLQGKKCVLIFQIHFFNIK